MVVAMVIAKRGRAEGVFADMAEERLPQIETVADLAALGRALERAAGRKYEALAEQMERHGRKATAALFRHFAETERGQVRAVKEWAARHGLPPALDDGAAERLLRLANAQGRRGRDDAESDLWARDPYLSTPYRALAYAVRNAERTFRLYSYLASAAAVPEVRVIAESLATEELDHANLLRAERRRAYHAERARGPLAELPSPRLVEGLAELLAVAAAVETRLAMMLRESAAQAPALAPLAQKREALARRLDTERAATNAPNAEIEKAIGTWLTATDQAQTTPGKGMDADPGANPGAVPARLHATAERAFAFYDGVFAHTPDEDVMLKAQALSRAALDLLTALSEQTAP